MGTLGRAEQNQDRRSSRFWCLVLVLGRPISACRRSGCSQKGQAAFFQEKHYSQGSGVPAVNTHPKFGSIYELRGG